MSIFSKKFCAKSPFKQSDKYKLSKEEEDRLYYLQNRDKIKEQEKQDRIKDFESGDDTIVNLDTSQLKDFQGGKNYVGGYAPIPGARGMKGLVKLLGSYFLKKND